jgi:hypothetical protein
VKEDELDTALGYFENNAPRMRYKWFRSRGLVRRVRRRGGRVQGGTGQRLKQSGMHWTTAGADAIITLRCREASTQWGNHLPRTAHPDRRRLTSPHPKTILITYKIDVHPRGRNRRVIVVPVA